MSSNKLDMTKPAAPKWEKDYSLFEHDIRNRTRKAWRLAEIRQGFIKFGGWNPAHPIVVWSHRGKLVIQGGSHRFEVAKELGLPILYVVIDKPIERLDKQQDENAWVHEDYLESFIQQGNEHYIKLKKFVDTYKMKIGVGVGLLGGYYKDSGSGLDKFQAGEFTVHDPGFATQVAELAQELQPMWKKVNTRTGLTTLSRLLKVDKFDREILKTRLKAHPQMIHTCGNPSECAEMLELIYNFKTNGKKVIHFHHIFAHELEVKKRKEQTSRSADYVVKAQEKKAARSAVPPATDVPPTATFVPKDVSERIANLPVSWNAVRQSTEKKKDDKS